LQWVVGLKQAHLHMYVQYASHVGSELIGRVSSYLGGNATHVCVCVCVCVTWPRTGVATQMQVVDIPISRAHYRHVLFPHGVGGQTVIVRSGHTYSNARVPGLMIKLPTPRADRWDIFMSTALMSHWRGIWEMAYTVHCVHTYTSGPIGLYLWVYICDASIEHHHGYKVGPIDLHAHYRNTNHDSMHACKKAIGPPTSQADTTTSAGRVGILAGRLRCCSLLRRQGGLACLCNGLWG
jgi:hypothetical protein